MSQPNYLVDYDLPADNRRYGFYKRVSDYRKRYDLENEPRSTSSVVITKDRLYAWFIHATALDVGGEAHIWIAERLDDG